MTHFRFDDWPGTPFTLAAYWMHDAPRRLDDGRWWVRGKLPGNSGGLFVDAIFEDLEAPAVELHGRDLDYMQRESAQTLKTLRAALEQLQADLSLTDRERVLLCRDLLRQLDALAKYADRHARLTLNTDLMDHLSAHYRAEEDQ